MARKRASLKDKGEEILGLKRGGKGTDILFGIATPPEPTPTSRRRRIAAQSTQPEQLTPAALLGWESLPEGEADLDQASGFEVRASRGLGVLSTVTQVLPDEMAMSPSEADLDQELDLDSLLNAEAEGAAGEVALPELATTPAAPAPPPDVIASAPLPPVIARPLPTTLPAAPPIPKPSGVLSPTVEQPAVTPPPSAAAVTPVTEVVRPVPAPPPAAAPPSAEIVPPPALAETSPPPPALAVAPPSTATGAPDLSVPRPPRYVDMVGAEFDLLAEDISPDAAAAALVGAPEGIRLTAEQRDELLRRRSVIEELDELARAIEGQYERILIDNVSVNKSITDWCHNMLAEARTIVLNRQVDQLARAEWNLEQVRARLDRATESRRQANRYAWPITIWGVAWFVIFVFLIFNPMIVWLLLPLGEGGDAFLIPHIFLRSLFFGGIGGVAAVFYHLFKYVQERTFDSQYVLSYAAKPFMGMILGSMIYLTVFVLLRALQIAPGGLQTGNIETVTDVMYVALLFFIAMAAGFKENLAFDLLSRVIKTILRSDQDQEVVVPPPGTTSAGS